jgi:hypothetical protein
MNITCPKNKDHTRFSVTAHVVQEWIVDKDGDFVEVLKDCLEVTHRPDKEDRFVCTACGTEAIVK